MLDEYISEGIILDTAPLNDLDLKISFFSYEFGKIEAKVKSSRKITSKLRGHIQPANLIIGRIIFKNYFQLVDALKQKWLNFDLKNLFLLDKILPLLQPEKEIYFLLKENKFDWSKVLKILGWNPKNANCFKCGVSNPEIFYIPSQDFSCKKCVQYVGGNNFLNNLIYIYGNQNGE